MVSTPIEPEFHDSDDESVGPAGRTAFVAASLSGEGAKGVTDTSWDASGARKSNEDLFSGATVVWASILGLAILVGSFASMSDEVLGPLALLLLPVPMVGFVVSMMRNMSHQPGRFEPPDRTVTHALEMMESEGLTWDEAWRKARTGLDQLRHED